MVKKKFSFLYATLLVVAAISATQIMSAIENKRLQREMGVCVTDYANASSRADTERIDKRFVVPKTMMFSNDTSGLTCRVFRGRDAKDGTQP